MSFASYLRKDARLVCLRVLAEMPGYRANSSVLTSMLDQFGHAVTTVNRYIRKGGVGAEEIANRKGCKL